MKKSIIKFLICAFVSAVGVVSFGRLELSPNQTVTAQIREKKEVDETEVNIVDNENIIVMSPEYEYSDGWTNTSVNVRKEPNAESEILSVYNLNTHVSYATYNEEWSIIEYEDTYAYIYSDYISDEECNYRIVNVPYYSGTKTWMAYTSITMKSSPQYKLQQIAYTGDMGIRMYDGRYCIAVGTGVTSNIGTYVDVVLENGTIINCIIGDIKSNAHTNSANLITVHSDCCSEFIVDRSSMNSAAKRMGDFSYACDEWNSRVVKFIVYDIDVVE